MALQKQEATYVSDGHVVVTGPIRGTVLTDDGTTYDVTDPVIEVHPDHAEEVAHLVGLRYAVEGHPTDPNFRYAPAERFASHQAVLQAMAEGAKIGPEPVVNDGRGGAIMALASAAAENAALNGLAGVGSTNVIPFVSLHTATPGTTGASETANSGSYARQACSWNVASGGSMTNSSSLTFSTLGSVAVSFIGTWSSGTYAGGTYAIGAALGSAVTAASITIAAGAITLSAS